ncbi:oxidoreductase [Corynebacterium diphtheriae]|nr:oxidoreductase [Corynebacterium diphtheriae]
MTTQIFHYNVWRLVFCSQHGLYRSFTDIKYKIYKIHLRKGPLKLVEYTVGSFIRYDMADAYETNPDLHLVWQRAKLQRPWSSEEIL